MKKLKLAVLALTVGLFTLTSCSDDDDSVSIKGRWVLKNAVVGTAIDLDGDGEPNTELKKEPRISSCLDGVEIIFTGSGSAPTGSFTYQTLDRLNIEKNSDGTYNTECTSNFTSVAGTWTKANNKITLSIPNPADANSPYVSTYTLEGSVLTTNVANGYKVFDVANQEYIEQQNVELRFKKSNN